MWTNTGTVIHHSKPRAEWQHLCSVTCILLEIQKVLVNINICHVWAQYKRNHNISTSCIQPDYSTVIQTTVLRSHGGNNHKGNVGMQNTVDVEKAAAHASSIQ